VNANFRNHLLEQKVSATKDPCFFKHACQNVAHNKEFYRLIGCILGHVFVSFLSLSLSLAIWRERERERKGSARMVGAFMYHKLCLYIMSLIPDGRNILGGGVIYISQTYLREILFGAKTHP